ncbi:MAG: dihydroorotase family protein [Treponema sp.]|jgi:dihydroorotase|nr:dihydroorotase family protein [Treponema sp.]
MKYDLVLKGGTLVDPRGTARDNVRADLGIRDGKLAAVADEIDSSRAEDVYDAGGLFVLPGLIDAHVHFRDPGLTYKEDFASGSAAAAHGGITVVADMPNTLPPTAGTAELRDKFRAAGEKSYTDFGLFALLTRNNLGEVEGLVREGALGFKVFLGTSVGNIAAPPLGTLYEQMTRTAGRRIAFHAEDNELNEHFTRLCRESGAGPALLPRSRPGISEAEAVARTIRLAEYTGAAVHICHVSARLSLALIREAKRRGLPLSAETCPQYLFLDSGDYPRLGTRMKVNPPVRDSEDREALWQGIAEGTIDMIASDHAPHTAEEKGRSLWEAPSGIAGVETSAALMLTAVNQGRLSLNDYARIASLAPARLWGLYPRKGGFTLGGDADFTIVDMNKTGVIRNAELHSKHQISPYDGFETTGSPAAALLRGCFIMKDGVLTGKPGFGRPVHPVFTGPVNTSSAGANPADTSDPSD